MTLIGDYTTQEMRELILRFSPGAYSAPSFGEVPLSWSTRTTYSATGNLQASIAVSGLYQEETYTYLRYCERYIIGYNQYGVQILKGRCYYGGIRDLAAYIGIWEKEIYSGQADLSGWLGLAYPVDLPALIDIHSPADLLGYINVLQQGTEDLPALVHGWVEAYLPASIRAMGYGTLPAYLNPVPPSDLPAYLKVWPMENLPGNIYGWQVNDLGAFITTLQHKDLPAFIGIHPWINLPARLKGWVREAIADLWAYIKGLGHVELPAIIRATYLNNLPGYVEVIRPVDIPANIYSWAEGNLIVAISGEYDVGDLRAQITANYNYGDLSARIRSLVGEEVPQDLPAIIRMWQASNVAANVTAIPAVNLSGYIEAIAKIKDLPASIYPKVVRLSSVISVITMEHLDLSGVINPSCIWSESMNLTGYLNAVYKSDLGAVLIGKRYEQGIMNLPSSIGYTDYYSFVGKLPISLTISTESYRYEDKFRFYFRIFNGMKSLTASIVGTYLYNDLSAFVEGEYLDPYNFTDVKNKERVYNLNYVGALQSWEAVEFSFKSIVNDYFYSSAGNTAWKTNRLEKWVFKAASYVPGNTSLNIKRKFHRIKYLYDLTNFNDIDEAVRFVIEYVTAYPYGDLAAQIASSGGTRSLSARVNVMRTDQDYANLSSEIFGVGEVVTVVVGTDHDDYIDII